MIRKFSKNNIKGNNKGEWKIQSEFFWLLIILVAAILVMWIGSWECINNSGCEEDELCAVNHVCYKIPTIEKNVNKTENKYNLAAVILGLSIIIAAFILRKENFRKSFIRAFFKRKFAKK